MASKRPATLQDVADQVGISRGAASFALSGRKGVSAETRERVKIAAAELGYRPNPIAKNFRAARTGVIAVTLPALVPSLSYYMEVTFGIVEEALNAGRLVTIIPRSPGSPQPPQVDVDGVIAIDPAPNDPVLEQLMSVDAPVVSGESMPAAYGPVAGEVRSDHAAAVKALLDHFVERGAVAPAIIVPESFSGWSEEIWQAYIEWCEMNGCAKRVETIRSVAGLPASTMAATRKLLSAAEPADAILSLTEGSALNVITSATEYGRVVGEDLLVAAAVDSPALHYTDPPITAINLHPRDFGRSCMQLMHEILEDGSGARRVDVPIDVVVRDSTKGLRH